MRLSEIVSRLSGISSPIGGISWVPPTPDVEVARRVLTFLEDRRVLYDPYEAEYAAHCIQSVMEIRHFLTSVLTEQGIADELADHLKQMRAAGRNFLAWFRGNNPSDPSEIILMGGVGFHDWRLNQALGELRAVFGLHIAQIAVKYGLDVESPLSETINSALPAEANDEEERSG